MHSDDSCPENYVTLFDSLYLPQGLALHASLQRHAGKFKLWVICVDDTTFDVLNRLQLPNCAPLKIGELETPELLRLKGERTHKEYCWTLTPFVPRFVFDADPAIERVTYVDADLWFFASPAILFSEFESSGKEVMITDHAYAPEYDQSYTYGQFCVQYITYTRSGGEPVRQWWQERCVEWCYARSENRQFGDQKYLDSWPRLFSDLVHVSTRHEALLAPWNAKRFPPSGGVAYHFHDLRLMKNRRVLMAGGYDIPGPTFELIYRPYVHELNMAIATLRGIGYESVPQITEGWLISWARATAHRWRWRWRARRRPHIFRMIDK